MIDTFERKNQYILVAGVNALSGNTVMTHAMFARPNAKSSDAAWQIQKLTYDADDFNTKGEFPQRLDNGIASADFIFVADNYASYSYGGA